MNMHIYRIIIASVVALMVILVAYSFIRMMIYRRRGQEDKARDCLKAVMLYVAAGIIAGGVGLAVTHMIG